MNTFSACLTPNQENKYKESKEEIGLYKTDSIYLLQNNVIQVKENCYSEQISLCVDGIKKYKDTVLSFRNSIEGNDEKRVVCNSLNIDKDIEDLIWKSQHIAVYLESQNNANMFSFILYNTDNHKNIIAKYFWCDRESNKAVEMKRFLVKNKKITGINVLPGIFKDFIPIEEYEKPHRGSID